MNGAWNLGVNEWIGIIFKLTSIILGSCPTFSLSASSLVIILPSVFLFISHPASNDGFKLTLSIIHGTEL
jgi:hypothetical protein